MKERGTLMRNSIIISVSELHSLVKDMKRQGMDYVRLTINDAEGDGEDRQPAYVDFSCSSRSGFDSSVDFETIDAVDNEADLTDL